MRVLVIEDDEPMRLLLSEILEDVGFQVVAVETCRLGWEMLQRDPSYGAAMIDWRTPDMSGPELLTLIKADARFEETRLIMVTGMTDMDDVMKALECGAHEYLMKPFTPEMVIDKLRLCDISLTGDAQG